MTALAFVADEERARGTTTINIRASRQTKELIDRAAHVVNKTRTEFILESARQRAEDVLLDQRLFQLDEEKFAEFNRLLDTPPKPTGELRKLLAARDPWEK